MSYSRLEYLFQRYIERTCSEEERQELLALIRQSMYDKYLKKLIDSSWDMYAIDNHFSNEKADNIFNTIIAWEGQYVPLIKKTFIPLWFKVAAIFLITITAGILYYTQPKAENKVAVKQQFHTDKEHRRIQLPDGSTVILNAGSRLEYPKTFDGNTREVSLVGEGYFDICHDTRKPFKVHTGKLITTVLGTAFNIKAYSREKSITVTVTRGKVEVGDKEHTFNIITPNQQVTYNGENSKHTQRTVNAKNIIEWQKKDVFFDDMRMDEAAKQLEERFGVKMNFTKEALKDCRFTGTFLKGESFEQILDVICSFNNVTYKYNAGGAVLISGEGCVE